MENQQPNETGGLIFFHTHSNFELLEAFADVSGKLYYKNRPVAEGSSGGSSGGSTIVLVKNDSANALILTPEGELFVDGTYFLTEDQYNVLSKFNYDGRFLTFNNKEVGLKADDTSVKNTVDAVWQDIDSDEKYNWLKQS